jgi:hypothetical protein
VRDLSSLPLVPLDFYGTGVVHDAWLTRDHVIDGIPCRSGVVTFSEYECLAQATLAAPLTIDTVAFPAGTTVELWNEANAPELGVHELVVPVAMKLHELDIPAGTRVMVSEDRTLLAASFATPAGEVLYRREGGGPWVLDEE